MDTRSIIEKARRIKPIYYWLAAFVIHLIFIMVTGPRIIFPGLLEKAKLTTEFLQRPEVVPRVVEPRQTTPSEVRMSTDVPARIMQQAPEIQQRIVVTRETAAPRYAPPPAVVTPERVDVSREMGIEILGKRVERADAALPRMRTRRTFAQREFARQFNIEGTGRAIRAEFQPYLLQYEGGDWNTDPTAIPNLMLEIERRTNMKAVRQPIIVKADSQELLELGSKALFVYMTGHHNFQFTAAEVENLRKYLLKGGTIWADNCFPGRRSRFDTGFRREMKRVMPDRDFETITADHPIFSSILQFREVPKGMNFRNDPVEIVMIDRRLAVVYTLNDYGCLWQTQLNEKGEVNTELDENWRNTWGPLWTWRGFVYDNLNAASINNAVDFGINIIVYLLERMQV